MDSDQLLQAIIKEEATKGKGNLKIFLGLAAGVGKTYAMLQEAHTLKKEGFNVLLGVIDTHGRKETEALLDGLASFPLKTLIYKGKEFQDLDVDGVIAAHPDVALIDELAHNNVPGSKHVKRWQDVLEILDAGINVYTTLNVQHIESLNDIVRGITDIFVRETVPDQVIDRAASIRVVDLTPDELIKRLHEGRVYFEEQSKIASLNFFKKDKLTALREIALRYAADKIDQDLRDMAVKEQKLLGWKPREKLLTAISTSPHSQKLIRVTRRLASAIDAPWMAVHVDNGARLTEAETDQLARNFALARDLGGEMITIGDSKISQGIQRIAKQRGITQIIIGRSEKGFLFRFLRGFTLLDQLILVCPDADIHVIREEKKSVPFRFPLISWGDYVFSIAIIGIISILLWLTYSFIAYKTALVIFYCIAAITIGSVISRERKHKRILEKSEGSTRALYEMVHQMATAPSVNESVKFIKERFDRLLHGTSEFALKDLNGSIEWKDLSLISNETEKNAAVWSINHGKECGFSTDTLPSANNLYIPLKGHHDIVGLLIYRPQRKQVLTSDEKNFIYAVCQHLSHYLERASNREKAFQHENLVQAQKIHQTILSRFSQAFKWPIEKATLAMEKLKKRFGEKDPEIKDIDTSLQLISKNLASIATMAELSEGMIPLKKSQHTVAEVIEESTSTANLQNHPVNIMIEPDLPLIKIDYYLIEILLNQLLHTAVDYSLPEGTLTVEAKKEEEKIIISIIGEGATISEDQLKMIFDNPSQPGLGLAMAKTIAELHEGNLQVENTNRGAKFTLLLPSYT